ncbi:hypothetical protein FACS1894187_10860 [Synergistales bacterium]|nr:hypothetical protein FACS1894187_10860 [Synergistales bacterium]
MTTVTAKDNELEKKIDSLSDICRSMFDMNKETLDNLKTQNDMVGYRMAEMEKNIEKALTLSEKLNEQIIIIDQRCAVRAAILPANPGQGTCREREDFGKKADGWMTSKVGQWLIAAVSGALTLAVVEAIRARLG